jgi:hypothetical protein
MPEGRGVLGVSERRGVLGVFERRSVQARNAVPSKAQCGTISLAQFIQNLAQKCICQAGRTALSKRAKCTPTYKQGTK